MRVDPRDDTSFLPRELRVAGRIDDVAFEHGLLVTSTHPQADGYAGDQVLLAPAYTSTDAELAEMVERFAATITDVALMRRRRINSRMAALTEREMP